MKRAVKFAFLLSGLLIFGVSCGKVQDSDVSIPSVSDQQDNKNDGNTRQDVLQTEVTAVPAITAEPESRPSSEATAVPTATTAPTDTPLPTATNTPTRTPEKTATNTPTSTLTPTPTHVVIAKSTGEYPCYVWVDCADLNLRKASTGEKTSILVTNGQKLYCTGLNSDGKFYKVQYEGGNYLISKNWTTRNPMYEYSMDDFKIVDFYDRKYSYYDMEEDIFQLAEAYPNMFKCEELGLTADNRTLYLCTVGNPEAEKCIYLCAGTHAREYVTSHLLMQQVEYYLANIEEGYYKDVYYDDLFNEICFKIMPMVNPDGVQIAIEGPDGINDPALRKAVKAIMDSDRKNKAFYEWELTSEYNFGYSRWKANAEGLDPNRGFPFGREDTKGTDGPSHENYKGTEAYECLESRIQKECIDKLMQEKDLVFAVSYHVTGNNLSWNVGQKGDFLRECIKAIDELEYHTGYTRDMNDIEFNDPVPLAGFTDWLNGEQLVPAVTIEFFPLGKTSVSCYDEAVIPNMEKQWSENREVWAILGNLYYEGRRY